MTVRGPAGSVEARLAAGRLRSPCCGAVLARWGWARRRVVAMLAGPEEFCPRRGRCRRCGRTHVLLPADLWSRRRYGAAVIMAVLLLAAAAAAAGRPAARPWLAGRDGSRWQVPASTARSWRSRFAGRAGALRQALMGMLPLADPLSRSFAPAGSPAGDCLAVLEAVTAGLRCRFPALAAVTAHEVAAHLTGGCGWPRRGRPSGSTRPCSRRTRFRLRDLGRAGHGRGIPDVQVRSGHPRGGRT